MATRPWVAAVAATDSKAAGKTRSVSVALGALTSAALSLPGIVPVARADSVDGGQASFEYHHYVEGKRDLDGQTYRDQNLRPIEADSLAFTLHGTVLEHWNLGLALSQDTWAGATPVTTLPHAAVADQLFSGASTPSVYYTKKGKPVAVDWNTFNGTHVRSVPDAQLVHIMGSASPETRRQAEGSLGYEGTGWGAGIGGGISEEPDYHSRFVNGDLHWDVNEKLTTLAISSSFTHSNINASLEANTAADWGAYVTDIRPSPEGVPTLYGSRTDFSANLGVTQVIDRATLLESSISITESEGYLSNPYKATILAFDDPNQFLDSTGLRSVAIKGTLEQRPREREQWAWDTRIVHYVEPLDASVHFDYRFYQDDWGITAHTFDAAWYQSVGDGWTVTPGIRYYSQSAAFFYKPFFYFKQAFPILLPRNPELPPKLDHSQIRLRYFSSDERLSAFGDMSGRIAISRPILKYASLEIGAEYSRHAGSLKLGGGGESSYADFGGFSTYLTMNIDLASAADEIISGGDGDSATADTTETSKENEGARDPAGLGIVRPLSRPGEIAFAFEHDYRRSGGRLRRDNRPVGDRFAVQHGCLPSRCFRTPTTEITNATTLTVAYAPNDWVTLIAQPHFVDRYEGQRALNGAPFPPAPPLGLPGSNQPPFKHSSGGIGDTDLRALARLYSDSDGDQLIAGLGLSLPTGSVVQRVNKSAALASYDLQLGSGTWDFTPSLAFIRDAERWTLGAQADATVRLSTPNRSGYALGNTANATAWLSYGVLDWLTATARETFTSESAIRGALLPQREPVQTGVTVVNGEPAPTYEYDLVPKPILGPTDVPFNYGGRVLYVGFGLNAEIPDGQLAGNQFGVEWQQPVWQRLNGYQLAKKGTLTVSWSLRI